MVLRYAWFTSVPWHREEHPLVANKRDARLRLGVTVDMALSPFLWTDAKHFDDDGTEVHCK